MADCSKTEVFLSEWKRMCDTNILCEKCELRNVDEETCTRFSSKSLCMLGVLRHADEVIAVVQKWSDEHPLPKQKTYADDFLEKFPKITLLYEGEEEWKDFICRDDMYGTGCQHEPCAKCWDNPYPEKEEENE